MKILIIGNYYEGMGGMSAVMHQLKVGCPTLGHTCDIHAVGGSLLTRPFKYLNLLTKIKNYDVLHGHSSSYSGFIPAFVTAILGFIFRKKVLITHHGSTSNIPFLKTHLIVKLTARLANKITTPLEDTAEAFKNYNVNSHHIPNILDADMWPYTKREIIRPRLINIRGWYNSDQLLEIFMRLVNLLPNVEATIVGLPATYIKKCPDKRIKCIGFIERSQIPNLFKDHDIYINNIDYDSFGYSMFEAMSSGLSIISVPSKSLSTYAPNVVNFAKDSATDSIIEKVNSVLFNQEDAINKIGEGLSCVSNYSWNNLKDSWRSIYEF